MKRVFVFLSCVLLCFYSASAEEKKNFAEPNMLYRKAMMLYVAGDYKEATEALQEIEKKAPDYPRIRQVLMNEAFFLYLDEKYPEATAVTDTYIEMYKFDNNLPYIYFLRASAFHKRKKSPTKEYELINETIKSWQDVIAHDVGMYSEEARIKILELEDMQCLHQVRVGDLYLGRKDYFAAIRRLTNALHCGSGKYEIEASKRLVRCYKGINMPQEAEKYQSIVDARENYEIPEELTFATSVKNILYDIVPDFGFLPRWMRVTT